MSKIEPLYRMVLAAVGATLFVSGVYWLNPQADFLNAAFGLLLLLGGHEMLTEVTYRG